jgi:hypothetical protein
VLANENPVHPDEIGANATKLLFLEEMGKSWNVYKATKKLGISRKLVYNEWFDDPEFKAKYDEILAGLIDGAQENILEQATQNKKAFVPAIFVLKAHMPEVYDRQALGGRIQGNVTINIGQVAGDTLKALDLTGKASIQIEPDAGKGKDSA